tara:strand:- start:31209 stop:35264 length:4056 start_codon:yes stop_codon:yes gene_type:complete
VTSLSQAQTTFKASLSGSNEVPAITTTANGDVTATLTGSSLVITGSFSGLTGDYAASHIHTAMAGTGGGVAFTLSPTVDGDSRGGTFEGANNTFALTSEQVATLEAQGMYVNIHSSTFGGGELRGQIVPQSDSYFKANLSGAFEVPAAKTMASGGVVLQMVGDSLFVSGSFNELSSVYAASHLHIAPAGSAGGVAFTLTADVEPDGLSGVYLASDNRFELTTEQKTSLMNREVYINIHTSNFAGGELRGQVTPPVTASFFTTFSGSAENPSVNTSASGAAIIELVEDTVWVSGSFNGLGSNYAASHLHTALTGSNGGVAFALSPIVDANNIDGVYTHSSNKFTLSTEQKTALLARGMYVNIHSADNAGGELRGQVAGDATAYFRTNLVGIHEVQPVVADASGGLLVEVSGSNAIVTGSYNNLSSDFGGAHIHSGSVSTAGGVEVALTATTSSMNGTFEAADNTYQLTTEQLTTMFDEGLYGNVHSTNNAGGEVRGQLLFGANTFAEASALTSPADAAELMLSSDLSTAFNATWETSTDADGNEIVYIWQLATDSTFDNIIVNANTGSDAMFMATHGDLDALLVEAGVAAGASATLYHRVIVTDGSDEAIGTARSVMVTRANASLTFESILSGSNEVPPITTTANGSFKATLTGTSLTVEGSFEGLSGDYAGSHIHSGMAGQAGGVEIALSPQVNVDNTSGSFVAMDTTYMLTIEQAAMLNAQGLYVNIHSSAYPGGELRGQLVPEANAHYKAFLSGAFEFPVAKTMASGGIVLQLDGDSLFVSGSFNNLMDEFDAAVAGGSHLHIGAAGRTGGIAIELVPTLETDKLSGVYLASDNRFELSSEQKTALMNREFYFNLHTKAFASGELRGQVVPQSTATFYASLSGTAEVPSIETSALGALVLELHKDTLIVTGSFGNLTGAFDATIAGGSHLHIGHAGENGGIAIQLDADVGLDLSGGVYRAEENEYTLTSEQIDALMDRMMYLNIHTLAFGSGELRGQVLGEASAYFRTNLSGIHEIQPIETTAYGALNVELSGTRAIVTGGFSGLTGDLDASIAGGAHLHAGSVTGDGGVEVLINTTVVEDTAGVYEAGMNTVTLTLDQATTLMNEGMYANIHSTAFASGELRGQLLFGDNIFPTQAELTAPANDVSLTLSGDAGILFEATWDEGSDLNNNEVNYIWQLSADAEFTDLLVNASVGSEQTFSADFGTLASIFDDAGIEVGTTANLYHRVITSDGSNEKASAPRTANIERGQVTSNEEELRTEPLTFGLNQNYPNPFNPSTSISFTLSETGDASLKVYNMLGQEVATIANSRLSAGSYTFNFDASQLSSGMYIYQLRAENQTITKRMTLIK